MRMTTWPWSRNVSKGEWYTRNQFFIWRLDMSEAKFTKGPWKFNANDGSITDCTKAENEIAQAQLDDWHKLSMGYANAHLIAAAPAMYDALEHILENQALGSPLALSINNLLAKARGE